MAKTIRRRSIVTVVVILAVVGVFLVRLVDIQVVKAHALETASTDDKAVPTTVYGARGDILDANGTALATSIMTYDVQLSPVAAKAAKHSDLVRDVNAIGRITGAGGEKIMALITDALKADPHSQYASVAKGIDVAEFQKLNALEIPWLYFTKHPSRTYPDGAVAGNIVGFVSGSGKPQAGIELADNSCLAGTDGEKTYQRGADGTMIPGSMHVTKKATDGGDVKLTIDADLQWFSQQKLAEAVKELGGTSGIVTIMEAKTGKLLTVAEYPSVDPNNVSATPPEYRGSRAFQAPFEPGSTFKSVTASALLDAGLATPTTHVLAPYRFTSGHGASLHDAGYHEPERLTLTGVLMMSSNTGMSILGSRMSDKQRYDYITKYGIGSKTAVDFPAQSSGILHPYRKWDDQTKYATMFGQGLAVTAIQMASVYQTIANDGVRLPVKLVDGCVRPDGTVTDTPATKGTRVISAKAAKETMGMLERVVTTGEDSKKLEIPGYRVAAKTGTAQQPNGHGGYKDTYFVTVMGMAPLDDPQYVVEVNIANPITIKSSAAAAPLFKTIMTQVLKTFRVKPSTTPPAGYPPYY